MFLHREKGFTLIEAVLYTACVSILMTGTLLLTSTALTMRSKLRASVILEENLRFTLQRVNSLVSGASAITSPALSTTGTTLTLTMPTPAENPTTISLNAGSLTLTQGSAPTSTLISNEIVVSRLMFTRVSSTTPTIRTVFTAGLRNATVSYPSITVTTTDSVRR